MQSKSSIQQKVVGSQLILITGSMLSSAGSRITTGGSIRLPLHVTDKMRTLEKKDKVAFEEYKSKIPVAVSLNKMISDSTSILDLVSDEDDTNILDRIDTEILMEQIKELLSEKEFDVLCNRYGLEGREQKTHRECAKIYGVSHTAVYLIEKKRFEKIRKTFATK